MSNIWISFKSIAVFSIYQTIFILDDRQKVETQKNDDKLRSQVETTNQANVARIVEIKKLCYLANTKEKDHVKQWMADDFVPTRHFGRL